MSNAAYNTYLTYRRRDHDMKAKRSKKTHPKAPRVARKLAPEPALKNNTDSFEAWKAQAALYAANHEALHVDDILAEDDPYDLADVMPAAIAAGTSPEDFIEDVFGEDIARSARNDQQAAEAYEHGLYEMDGQE